MKSLAFLSERAMAIPSVMHRVILWRVVIVKHCLATHAWSPRQGPGRLPEEGLGDHGVPCMAWVV